jgi:hypothetical protein
MYYLPWWMQWAQAIALIVISCLGSRIAYKQVRIATAKLNLDLYEKRFAVFDQARIYLRQFVEQAQVTMEEINAFIVGTGDAVFLFDDDVRKVLDELRNFGVRHRRARMQLKGLTEAEGDSEFRTNLKGELEAYAEELPTLYPRLITAFKPYLKLGNI